MSDPATTEAAAEVTARPVSIDAKNALVNLIQLPEDVVEGVTARLVGEAATLTVHTHHGDPDKGGALNSNVELEASPDLVAALKKALDDARDVLHRKTREDIVEHLFALRGGA